MEGRTARGLACLAVAFVLIVPQLPYAYAQQRVAETVHNLSVSGPGEIRAETEQQICIFCHAPHSTAGVQPLWNREFSVTNYTIYTSSTFDATPGQPTGASKLCLSCHDGTIALGAVLSRSERIRMVGGDFIPAGLTNLGTDLSDDHPISFHYTSGLAAADRQLKNPATLPEPVSLDADGQLQCTACHDPHQNRFRMFLTVTDEFGELCNACHNMGGWNNGAHAQSTATVAGVMDGDWPYADVAANACRSCHRSHTAGGNERLLIFRAEEENCLDCHNGQVAQKNIQAELDKTSVHDPRRYRGLHDPAEPPFGFSAHVECADCHNPHASAAETDVGDTYLPLGATMQELPGVTSGGGYIERAQFEYEICFRCHGDSPTDSDNRIVRQADQPNLRIKFGANNPSYHPVVAVSPGVGETPSLDPGIAPGSLMRCTDCHNNDSGPRAGGSGPDGPHGSIYDFLLERNYDTRDGTPESAFAYAACYDCHRRASILSNESFPRHSVYVQDQNTPCSACHDPHGVSNTIATSSDHTHLINFDLSIVRPLTGTNTIRFEDTGMFSGSCTLTCHNFDHNHLSYGE